MTNQPVHSTEVRIGDREREMVAARLARAQAEGRLDLLEYDERLQAAYAARTAGELARLTADLPAVAADPPVHRAAEAVRPPAARDARGLMQRGAVAAWASVGAINLAIWAVICVATGSWIYPWWIWVAGPWGAVLLAGWIGGRLSGGSPPARC